MYRPCLQVLKYISLLFYESVTHPSDAVKTFLVVSVSAIENLLGILVQSSTVILQRWFFPSLSSPSHFLI
jgi:hypothetical protein